MFLQAIRAAYRKSWQWLKDQAVMDVPETHGLCEFDCRKGQCTEGEWANCERRIQKAAGELWPESHDTQTRQSELNTESSQTEQQSSEK
jgi:hypothetical protein